MGFLIGVLGANITAALFETEVVPNRPLYTRIAATITGLASLAAGTVLYKISEISTEVDEIDLVQVSAHQI